MKKKLSLLLIIMMISMLLLSCSGVSLDGVWKSDLTYIDFNDSNQIITNRFFDDEVDYIGSYSTKKTEDGDNVINEVVLTTADYGTVTYEYELSGTSLKLIEVDDNDNPDDNTVIEFKKSERRSGIIRITIGTLLGIAVNYIGDYAIAIIIFTILLKVVLLPISINQMKSTAKMNKVQPIVAKINEKYKHDKAKAQQKTMELYQKAKINPLAGCLPLIINMVLLISFFRVLMYPDVFIYFQGQSIAVTHPHLMEGSFLWISNLSEPDLLAKIPFFANIIPESLHGNIPGIMPILTALVTLFSFNSMATPQANQQSNAMMSGMKYFMPLMFLFLGASYPASLMVYWTVSSVFQLIQQPIIKKLVDKEVE